MLTQLLDKPGGVTVLLVATAGIVVAILGIAWALWIDDEGDDR